MILFDFGPTFEDTIHMSSHGGYRPGAGRPRGSRNRLSDHRDRVAALFKEKGYDPMAALILEAQNPETPQKLRVNIHKELLNYVMPRQKASEIRVEEDYNITVVLRRFGEPEALPQAIDVSRA